MVYDGGMTTTTNPTPTSTQLYAINDAITALADRFSIREQFAAGADDDYDDMLDDAAHAVAKIFWPDV